MFQNQESAIQNMEDQTEDIRNIGFKTLLKNVETGLERIRETLDKKEDEFFF